jgi:enoyl-CoA hydratase/carnithine racemase
VGKNDLDAAVVKMANKFQTLPPRTVGVAKHILNEGHNLSLRESQELEIETQAALLGTTDLQEAIDSYVEKRRPHFTGE